MMASRGMGAINPSKVPGGKTMHRKDGDKFNDNGVEKQRRDGDEFTMFAAGGHVKDKWIQDAVKKPGALHAQMGIPPDEKIPAKKLAAAAKAPGKLGQRARLAQTLKGMK
jgi:hypothetical protein